MSVSPLFSVITPSYNQAAFLESCILSVLSQDYRNIEYLIIDGGSSDGSLEIIKKYENHLSYWVSERDQGQADAINKGLLKATGEFICWVNSDDLIYPDFISSRLKQFQHHPDIDMIYGDVDEGPDPDNSWLRKGKQTSFLSMLKTLNVPIPQQSAIWKRNVLEETGLLDSKWHVLLDMDYFIRIAKNHRILYIPGALAFFRIHKNSKSINEAIKWAEELPRYYLSIIEKWEDYKERNHLVMAKCYWNCSKIYSENNNLEKARDFREKAKGESLVTFARLWFIQVLVKVKHIIFL
jgi:glycosyltransferase involved in cell wall biosynthesis